MKRTIFILLMLTGLALNLTKNGWEICSTQTLRAEAWDSADYQDNYDADFPKPNDQSDSGIFGDIPGWHWDGNEWTYTGNDVNNTVDDTSDINNGYDDGTDDSQDDADNNEYDNGLSGDQDGDENSTTDYQKFLLEGVDKLSGADFGRENRHINGLYDSDIWTSNPNDWSLDLNNNKSPSEGIMSIFNHPEVYSFDCAEFVQVLIWYAKMETMGENAFNNYIGENMELNQDYSTGIESKTKYTRESPNDRFEKAVNIPEGYTYSDYNRDYLQNNEMVVDLGKELSDLPVGSRVCLENLEAPKGAAFQFENIIKVGVDQWAGHPYSQEGQTYSLSDLIDMFAREFNSDISDIYVKEIEIYK